LLKYAFRSTGSKQGRFSINFPEETADEYAVTTHHVPLPADQSTVIGRSLCLASLVVRGTLESAILLANGPDDFAAYNELTMRLSRWLNEQDFTAQFTMAELDVLSTTPGEWYASDHDSQNDRVEALGVLLWSLSLLDPFPSYEKPFLVPDLHPLIGWTEDAITSPNQEKLAQFPYDGSELLAGIAHLRPQPMIAAQRTAAECWQWRAHVAALQRSNTPPPTGQSWEMIIGIAAEEAHAGGAIPRPIGRDFPLLGKPFSRVPEAEQIHCGKVSIGRRVALDWLCGYATAWDAIPVAQAAAAAAA
jgi:hypothetical protein